MEEWVRIRNERDRKVLAWLRGQVSDTAISTAAQACARGDSKPYLSAVCRQRTIGAGSAEPKPNHQGSRGEAPGSDVRNSARASD
ncbi:hypothetical protein SBC2_83710 (plasmid) [Caballeronia sp. SBC2]|nr:hypothetical protein SBC2_83710 [Caballeronia sp. SBC2]